MIGLVIVITLLYGIGLVILSVLDFFVLKEPIKFVIFYDIIFLLIGIIYIYVCLHCYK